MDDKKKVLVVDDEERIRRLIQMYLAREEYEVEEADNGRQALEMNLEKDYEVILLEIMKPQIDVIEDSIELRKQKPSPVIMLTAKGEESNRVQGFKVGADDYIV